MHLMYGLAEGNARAAARLYRERYPQRDAPDRRMFSNLHHNLCEYGSLRGNRHSEGRPRVTRTPRMEQNVLDTVRRNPSASVRAVATAVGESRNSVHRVLQREGLHPYHLQRVQLLLPADYPARERFARWYLDQCCQDAHFPSYVLMTDEAYFTREGMFNYHNVHLWAGENPHGIRPHAAQHRFSVNVWAGLVGDVLVGPYLLPSPLTSANYLIFFQEVLPTLLDTVPQHIRRHMWFQHDGAPPHYGRRVRAHLNHVFRHRWIGRGGPVPWPSRSPDLNSIDFFFWGALKSVVYATPVNSDEDLVARIVCAAADIQQTAGIFERVRQSMVRRCNACIASNGGNIEHLL